LRVSIVPPDQKEMKPSEKATDRMYRSAKQQIAACTDRQQF
jgi:hypothetical protein